MSQIAGRKNTKGQEMKRMLRFGCIAALSLSVGIVLVPANVLAFEPWFDARVDYGAGENPASVFSIDLDGDGDNDLAVANRDSDNV